MRIIISKKTSKGERQSFTGAFYISRLKANNANVAIDSVGDLGANKYGHNKMDYFKK